MKNKLVDSKCDGSITSDLYAKKIIEYTDKQQDLEDKLRAYTLADKTYYLTINKAISLAQRAYDIFLKAQPHEKRQLLNFLLQNCWLRGRKLQFKLKAPFDTVLLASNCPNWLPGQGSNLQHPR